MKQDANRHAARRRGVRNRARYASGRRRLQHENRRFAWTAHDRRRIAAQLQVRSAVRNAAVRVKRFEACHGQVFTALATQAKRLNISVPRDLPHAMIFFTAGEAVRRLDSTYVPYADAFEVRLHESDARSAEEFARCALEEAPWPVRGTVRIAHRYLLRLRLGPRSSRDHLFGWKILSS